MFRSVNVRDKNISVRFQNGKLAIINDDQLLALLKEMPEAATDELVSAIKKEYYAQFNKDLDVKDASIAVEIWGHVFAEKFANAVKEISPIAFVDSLADKINAHCEIINIGEKENDNNRFVWDALAVFKPAIAAFLPDAK